MKRRADIFIKTTFQGYFLKWDACLIHPKEGCRFAQSTRWLYSVMVLAFLGCHVFISTSRTVQHLCLAPQMVLLVFSDHLRPQLGIELTSKQCYTFLKAPQLYCLSYCGHSQAAMLSTPVRSKLKLSNYRPGQDILNLYGRQAWNYWPGSGV